MSLERIFRADPDELGHLDRRIAASPDGGPVMAERCARHAQYRPTLVKGCRKASQVGGTQVVEREPLRPAEPLGLPQGSEVHADGMGTQASPAEEISDFGLRPP